MACMWLTHWYNGCQVSIWPPPRTIKKWPRGHRCNRFLLPVSGEYTDFFRAEINVSCSVFTEFTVSYRHEPYIEDLTKCKVIPASVSTPLSSNTLTELLKITKKCLKNNFLSSFLTVAGAAVLLHYKSILDVQDECPLLLCFSSTPGTGE